MSTKNSTVEDDLLYYDTFASIYFRGEEHLIPIFRPHVEKGMIQIESFMEHCLANESNGMYSVESVNGRDFTDGSDSKKVTTRTHSNNNQHGAKIPDHKTKIGMLRVTVLHKITRQFHYFAIPKIVHELYGEVNINFYFTGGAKQTNLSRHNAIADLSAFEVDSFQRLATITETEAIALGKNAIVKTEIDLRNINYEDESLPYQYENLCYNDDIQMSKIPKINFDEFFTKDPK